MQKLTARTDLAIEASTKFDTLPEGVELRRLDIRGLSASELRVLSDAGARSLGKPRGRYVTLELPRAVSRRSPDFADAAAALSELLLGFEALKDARSVLIACLGNRAVTPDALGPCAADGLIVTRHLKASLPEDFAAFSSVAVLRTGVLGTTGIESTQAVKATVGLINPDCVVAVDALASAELPRLCRNVQLCDSGIAPGSGVGNDRAELSSAFLGVPTIAVGVPTVSDASSLCGEAGASRLFVTPRNIDELVSSAGRLIACGLNLALHKGLTLEDIEALTS